MRDASRLQLNHTAFLLQRKLASQPDELLEKVYPLTSSSSSAAADGGAAAATATSSVCDAGFSAAKRAYILDHAYDRYDQESRYVST